MAVKFMQIVREECFQRFYYSAGVNKSYGMVVYNYINNAWYVRVIPNNVRTRATVASFKTLKGAKNFAMEVIKDND